MAYNMIAEATDLVNWEDVHACIRDVNSGAIEAFPISEETDGHARHLGISIPFSKLDMEPDFWTVFVDLLRMLDQKYGFKVYDLYGGKYVHETNLAQIKENLYG